VFVNVHINRLNVSSLLGSFGRWLFFSLVVLGISDAQTVYRLLVGYTPAAASYNSDMMAFVSLAVEETNQAYINSEMSTRVALAGVVEVDHEEMEDAGDEIAALTYGSGALSLLHTLREDYAADVVVLFGDGYKSEQGFWVPICGWARGVGVGPDSAFAIVRWDCEANGWNTFAHEIGHLFGGRHWQDPATTPFEYCHGYLHPSYEWRTIMVSNPDNPNCSSFETCTRLLYYSSPNVYHPITSDPMGTDNWRDVARCHDERVEDVSDFRGVPSSVELEQPIRSQEFGDVIATNQVTLSSGFSVQTGGQLRIRVGSSGGGSLAKASVAPRREAREARLDEVLGFSYRLSRDNLTFRLNLSPGSRFRVDVLDFNGRKIGSKSIMAKSEPDYLLPSSWFVGQSRIVRVVDVVGARVLIQKVIAPL
jgi:hypothetical protein